MQNGRATVHGKRRFDPKLYFADQKPADAPDGNWLPTPKGTIYRLTFRYYGPTEGVASGTYYPPPLIKR
jgi:hypothetical protein